MHNHQFFRMVTPIEERYVFTFNSKLNSSDYSKTLCQNTSKIHLILISCQKIASSASFVSFEFAYVLMQLFNYLYFIFYTQMKFFISILRILNNEIIILF